MISSLKPLLDALDDKELVLFIGSDIPRAITGIPSRAELARQLAADHEDILGEDAILPFSLDEIADRLGKDKAIALLSRLFSSSKYSPHTEHNVKANMDFYEGIIGFLGQKLKYIVTTAYDQNISTALNNRKIGHIPVVGEKDTRKIKDGLLTLFYIYGSVNQKRTLVVDKTDHLNFYNIRQKVIQHVRPHLENNVILLIGYDLSDHNSFLTLHSAIRDGDDAFGTYAIWPGLSGEKKDYWKQKKINIIDSGPEEWFGKWSTLPVYDQAVTNRQPSNLYSSPEYFDLETQTDYCIDYMLSHRHGLIGFAIPCVHNGVVENLCKRLESELNEDDQNTLAQMHGIKPLSATTSHIDDVINGVLQYELPIVQNGDGDVIFQVEIVEQKRVIEFWNALSVAIKKVETTQFKLPRRLIVILPIQSPDDDLPQELCPPLDAPIFRYSQAKRWVRWILTAGEYPPELTNKWADLILTTCLCPGDKYGNLDPDMVYSHIREIGNALREAKKFSPVLKAATIGQVLDDWSKKNV